MRLPESVYIDQASPLPPSCVKTLLAAGLRVEPLEADWPPGAIVLRWLDRSNAGSFSPSVVSPGPLAAVAEVAALRIDEVAIAAGSAHSYYLADDPPEVVRATLLSGMRRWEIDRRLEESESRFRFIAENAGDVIWTWNIRSRRYEFISPSIRNLRGLSVEQALVEPIERSLRPESLNKSMAQLAQGLVEYRRTGTMAVLTDIYEQPHADGTVRNVEITTTLLLDAEGEPEKLLGVSRDATERVVAEKALKAALGERDTLLRELGHRIKNTLSLTGSLLSLAESRVRDPADAGLFQDSRDRVQAMATLYDRLLRSRSQSSIVLGEYLSALCSALAEAYAPDGGMTPLVEVSGIEVDSRQAVSLGLAVNEAVTNALKYAVKPGSPLTVTVAARPSPAGDSYELSVSDDGIGLPEGFDPDRGEGIGFLLIRSLAEQLGATMSVGSVRNAGTTIRIGPLPR